MKGILKNNLIFIVPFAAIWATLVFVLLMFTKADIHLFVNKYHNSFFDTFFRITTFLGDGLTPALLSIATLFISFRKSFILGGGAIIVGVFSQVLKRLLFSDILRPKAYFDGIAQLYFVPNVDVHTHFSFPSGHTTTAFFLFFTLAYFTKNNYLKIFYLLLALIAGYSRIYLSQHFLIDVYFGAILGLLSAFISILFFEKIKKSWLDKSLITIYKVK